MTNRRGDPVLEARNLSFSYASPVIRDFSLSVPAGLITGIIGPNGSGKPQRSGCSTALSSLRKAR